MSLVRRRLITGKDIKPGTLTGELIADNSIPGSKLVDESVPGIKLIPETITVDRIAKYTITDDRLSQDLFRPHAPELAPVVGVNDTYGDYVEYSKPEGIRGMILENIYVTVYGINLQENEKITIEFSACFEDDTCKSFERRITLDGEYSYDNVIIRIIKDYYYLVKVRARAKSNLSSTSAIVKVYPYLTAI